MDDSMQRVTYGELKQKIIDVGRHLSVRQLVVIEMGNNMDSVIFYLGCLFRGTVAILVHENLSEFELSEYIEKFQPEYLFLLIWQVVFNYVWPNWSNGKDDRVAMDRDAAKKG